MSVYAIECCEYDNVKIHNATCGGKLEIYE